MNYLDLSLYHNIFLRVEIQVRLLVDEAKGAASGGTIYSIFNFLEATSITKLVEMSDPFCLAPRDPISNKPIKALDKNVLSAGADNMIGGYDNVSGKYTMPWIMQGIDTRVVNRSNALKNWKYGRNFLYSERMIAPSILAAAVASILFPLVSLILFIPFTRSLAKLFLPKPGEGPSQEILDTGFFKLKFWGRGISSSGSTSIINGGVVAENGDPGYAQVIILHCKYLFPSFLTYVLDI
jgi:short subunit dehydrogenase-like uncharacterized protein